ncbi:MAG: hypothetical protein PHX82_13920 [Paracoccaceae bacterium]|jgi:hypothetical protein|nr:hypothetical protein [Paracoccaceae bacterium]
MPVASYLRRILAGLGLLAALSACVPPGGVPASNRITVAGGALTLAAPRGYCVDPTATRDTAEGAFVLFGTCAAISRDPNAPRPAYRALLSATLGPQSAGPMAARFAGMEAFFRSEPGRAALARSGQARDVTIEKVTHTGDLLLLKINDRSAPQSVPVAARYWRAIGQFGGHVTALSVMPLQAVPLDDSTQIALLKGFASAIRAAN